MFTEAVIILYKTSIDQFFPRVYFPDPQQSVMDYTRTLDSERPVTFVCNRDSRTDMASDYADVIAVNNYAAWYGDYGHTEVIVPKVTDYLKRWNEVIS